MAGTRSTLVAPLVTGAVLLGALLWAWSLPVACSAVGGVPCGGQADRNPALVIGLSAVVVMTGVGVWASRRSRRGGRRALAAIVVTGVAGVVAVLASTGFALVV